jgi:Winged helix DNA-binding domain
VKVSWEQALAWRLRRQFVDPQAGGSAAQVVSRLCGVQAQVASAAETAIRLRQAAPQTGEVARALGDGTVIKTWAMRGTLHLLRSAEAPALLSLLAQARPWARPSWQKASGLTEADVDALVEAITGLLTGAVLTRDELVTRIIAEPRFAGLEQPLRSGWGSLLKPAAWHGGLCYGPAQGSRVTFTAPASAVPGWAGLLSAEEAGPAVIAAYLGAYGPATQAGFSAWMSRGFLRAPAVRGWLAALGDRVTEVEVDGEPAWVLAEHADELAACPPARGVRLLGGFDQWVLGPGTDAVHILDTEYRAKVSKTSGWIAPLVLTNGRVTGTWELDRTELVVSMFPGARRPAARALAAEAGKVAQATGVGPLAVRFVA